MSSGRQNQLTKQTGEYLVSAELCRRGYIATSFTGNVPDYDVIAIDKNNRAIPVQVKTIRSKSWQLNARNYLDIEIFVNKMQHIKKRDLPDSNLVHIFVKLNDNCDDEFYIFRFKDLQEIVYSGYKSYLEKHGGKRPKSPGSTHTDVSREQLSGYKDSWELLNE
jgi:hypothetical protein